MEIQQSTKVEVSGWDQLADGRTDPHQCLGLYKTGAPKNEKLNVVIMGKV